MTTGGVATVTAVAARALPANAAIARTVTAQETTDTTNAAVARRHRTGTTRAAGAANRE